MQNIYFIQDYHGPIKIGMSNRSRINKRLMELQIGNPYPLKVLAFVRNCEFTEDELHRRFDIYRIGGEWFEPAPELLKFIDDLNTKHPHKLNMKKSAGRLWTDDDREYVKNNYGKLPMKEICDHVGRKPGAVHMFARRVLGIDKSPYEEHRHASRGNNYHKVLYDKNKDKWMARWKLFTTSKIIGWYDTKEQAREAYINFLYMDRDERIKIEENLEIEQ